MGRLALAHYTIAATTADAAEARRGRRALDYFAGQVAEIIFTADSRM